MRFVNKMGFLGNYITRKMISARHKDPIKFNVKLNALRKLKVDAECRFKQGDVGDCFLVSTLKSTLDNLNLATKTANQELSPRNWLRKLVTFDTKNNTAEVIFPGVNKKVIVNMKNIDPKHSVEGSKRLQVLEHAYGILAKSMDVKKKDAKNVTEALEGGRSFVSMGEIMGLKSARLASENAKSVKEKNLYIKYCGKLFKKFKAHPENLIVTVQTKQKSAIGTFPSSLQAGHAYSLEKVADDGLIIFNPWNKYQKTKVSFDDFLKYFSAVDFARFRPEKMFNKIDEAKKLSAKAKIITEDVFKPDAVLEQSRDVYKIFRNPSRRSLKKGAVQNMVYEFDLYPKIRTINSQVNIA